MEKIVTKEELIRQLTEAGDAVVTYRSANSNKKKYNVCTLDFSTPYIKDKPTKAREDANTLKTFCWDTDSYRLIKPANVISVEPLSNILRNRL